MALEEGGARVFAVTLGISQILEQQSLDLSFHGSADGETWSDKPLAAFPQKFYCGIYTMILDLGDQPDVRFIRAQWKVRRWGRGEPTPLFHFGVYAEPLSAEVLKAAV